MGAAAPDIVDGAAFFFRRSHAELGQWMGHSLVGALLVCPVVSVAIAVLLRRLFPKLAVAIDPHEPKLGRALFSGAIGALSHVVTDLVSHDNFILLWPWYESDDAFPRWWSEPWTKVSLPFYREPYPIAPPFVVWCVLNVAGIALFIAALRRVRRSTLA